MFLYLANVNASDPLVVVVLGVVALVPVVNGALAIIRHFKSDPPAHHYALKHDVDKDLAILEARLNARINSELTNINVSLKKLGEEVDKMTASVTQEIKEINRSLGKLEGQG